MEPPTPPAKRCEQCNAPQLKKPDPDGRRLCFAHSQAPEIVAKRSELAAKGRAAGERQRGISPSERRKVIAGVVDIDQARARALDDKRKAKRQDMAEKVEPIDLGSKSAITAYLGKEAGRLAVTGDGQVANAAAALARAALAVLGFEDLAEDDGEGPRGFAYQTTEGRAVAVRGRESPADN